MHIHILGICGTFMGGLAALAREAGHRVTGCDTGVYPPMSDQLRALGIELIEGYGTDSGFFRAAAEKFVYKYGFRYDGSGESLSQLKKKLKN